MFVVSLFVTIYSYAQESPDVKVNGQDVGSWFSRYWIWVAGTVLLLVLIILFSRGSNRTKRTDSTITRDDFGNISSTSTTTEIKDE
ncbi:hypothetical protein DN068_07570 [Taibaiella soli]|uniref:Uncharacterized protein n=1 Tax=Taibaiella soli TaxID=1649169 RepID=A0A2W2AJ22_9BACT|nr:hypothetical protein DN068_07570 [Taibaiella soli]